MGKRPPAARPANAVSGAMFNRQVFQMRPGRRSGITLVIAGRWVGPGTRTRRENLMTIASAALFVAAVGRLRRCPPA